MKITREMVAFRALGMPGMRLKERPIVNRCACGQRISDNKRACKACKTLSEVPR